MTLEQKRKDSLKLYKDYKADHDWLTDGIMDTKYDAKSSLDDPTVDGFKEWVDLKFVSFDKDVKDLVKAIYYCTESISDTWSCSIGSSFDAKWHLIVGKKVDKRFEVGVAYSTLSGKISDKSKYLGNEDRIKKALQYKLYKERG